MTDLLGQRGRAQGYLYRDVGEFDNAHRPELRDVRRASLMWSRKDFGKAANPLADGHLWMRPRPATLLVHCTPRLLEEAALARFLGEPARAPCNGRMYVRDLQNVYCLEIK